AALNGGLMPANRAGTPPACGPSFRRSTGGIAPLKPWLMATTPRGVAMRLSRRTFSSGFARAIAWFLWALLLTSSFANGKAFADNEKSESKTGEPVEQKSTKDLSTEEKAALAEGQALFRGLCSGCHGGTGRGGKGPDLTDNRWLHGDKDEDIARVIKNGVAGTTMKKLGESLKDQQIALIIGYIRSLAKAPGESSWKPYMKGDAKAGEQLFFDEKGKALCAKCHTVNRKGGRVGPALDRIASRRSPEFIMESIVQPSKFIDPLFEAVQAITAEGKVLQGLRINETNFSIQVRGENGKFNLLLQNE